MKIEKAEKKDLQEILELQKLAYRSEAEIYNDFTIPPMTQTLEEIKSDFLKQTYLKIPLNGKIIGSIRGYIENGTCFIGRIIVIPDLQNQGLGTKLINEIETIFNNAVRFELFTGYRSKKNLYLYEKLGYKRFRSEKVNERLTMIYLEKNNWKLAYCGDICNYCPRYIATLSGNEEELRKVSKLMKRVGWPYNLEEPEKMRCLGCQDVKFCEYNVKECCFEKKIKNCGECINYPCVKIKKTFEKTQKNEDNFKNILSPEEYEIFRKAFFLKKKNLDEINKKAKKKE